MATPSSLLKYRQQERILLSDISHLVLDEADTLLDESFVDATTSIVRAIKLREKKPPKFPDKAEDAQVTVVGATLSDHVIDAVEKLVPVSSCNPGEKQLWSLYRTLLRVMGLLESVLRTKDCAL